MILLSSVTQDEDVLIAGLMHDALEDIPEYTEEMLADMFGQRVLDIVLGVTEIHKLRGEKALSWKIERLSYIENLKISSDDSILVSLADKIQNTRGYIELLNNDSEAMTKAFGSNHADRLWFHKEVLTIGEERLGEDYPLVEELHLEIEELSRVVSNLATK